MKMRWQTSEDLEIALRLSNAEARIQDLEEQVEELQMALCYLYLQLQQSNNIEVV